MAHGQHTTRRAFFKGAVAAIAVANVAGTTAVAAQASFPTPDMMRMAADGLLTMYRRYGVQFIPQPDGRVSKCVDAGEDTAYDEDVVTGLDRKMETHPDLHQAVIARVREIYSA
jgi:hypothetical protein